MLGSMGVPFKQFNFSAPLHLCFVQGPSGHCRERHFLPIADTCSVAIAEPEAFSARRTIAGVP